jgi:hypothetical protein
VRHFFIIFILLIFCHTHTNAQSKKGNAVPPGTAFHDSLRWVLENTRGVEAIATGTAFVQVWNTLGLTEQQLIQKQVKQMHLKAFGLKPNIINYLGAIVHAQTTEKTDAAVFTSFLNVSGLVIENYSGKQAAAFFEGSKNFFLYHALHKEKVYKLKVSAEPYRFDFIAPAKPIEIIDAPPPPLDTIPDDDWADTSTDEINNDEAYAELPPVTNEPRWKALVPTVSAPFFEGPIIVFDKTTLTFVTRYDSASIENTKGSYSFFTQTFNGEGGKFNFTSAKLSADSVFCELGTYFFKTNKPEFKSEMAMLTYRGKLAENIPGRLEFRSLPRKDSVAARYPVFISYPSDIEIQNVLPAKAKLIGGVTLRGNQVSTQALYFNRSFLKIEENGNPQLKAYTNYFTFGKKSIYSDNARVSLFHGNDSVSHPALRFSYRFITDSLQNIQLFTAKGNMRYAPFSSSYFNLDFAVNKVDWNLAADSLNMTISGGRTTVPMIVESVDYYDPADYQALQIQLFNFHPLLLVTEYVKKRKTKEFYVSDLALFANKDLMIIRQAVDFLAEKGMVDYFPESDFVRVKEKAIRFQRSQKKMGDYDNMKIHSVIDSLPNATLNFAKNQLTVRGVEAFQLSDSLNCFIKPDSGTIVFLQNRDLKFNGKVSAGNFEITGKDFTLKYDSFFINLNKIDFIGFFVTEKNKRGQTVRRRIDNSMQGADSTSTAAAGLTNIRGASGTLYISKPNNKSGRLKSADFPRLDATSGGVIYFDRKEILNGTYDRSVFFVVPPFKLDSLNDADPAAINFDGTFVTNGMFPNFKEKLHTMPDKSLGFEHAVPKAGYNLYKGEGKFFGQITLDKKGIRSQGRVNYLAAHINSSDFIFYPDSVIAKGNRAWMDRKQVGAVAFPQGSFPDYSMVWKPKKDEMTLRTTGKAFNFYDSTAQLNGSIIVSKNGVAGDGSLKTRGTELLSKEMNFTSDAFTARHALFKVLGTDPTKPALAGTDVKLNFNLKDNFADIGPEVAGDAAIEFPYAQFKTSIPRAVWDLNTQKITMSKDKDVPLEDSYFYTTRKDLDSLRFNASKAEYDIKKQELKVSGIPYIVVADAKITPNKNEVLILENAQIGTLKNTTIVLDTINGYHKLKDGVIDIKSRNAFSGYATYQYVNFLKDTFDIKMTDFRLEEFTLVDSTKRSSKKNKELKQQTVANGTVNEDAKLVLSAGMFYKGDMKMYATRPALELDGLVKLDIKKIKNYNTWIAYKQSGEETGVYIDFDNAITENGTKVDAGLHFDSKDNGLYISFLSDKRQDEDEDFFVPSGKLFYDAETKEFKIEDLEKAAGTKLSGKVFSYSDDTQQIKFEGPVNLFSGTSSFNLTSTVIGQGNLNNNDIKMNAMVLLDTKAPPAIFDIMARDIQKVIANEGAGEGLGDLTELLYKVADIVGEREARVYEQKSAKAYTSLATLAGTAKPINFANVNFKWSQEYKAFYSEGNLGISNIGRNDINGSFEGFMEIKKNEDGLPVFNVFFKASPESWYSFSFEDNRLLIHSSNPDFNSTVSKKTNSGKAKVGDLVFIPGSDEETLAFINRFRKDYYGIEVPYSLSAGTSGAKKKEEKKEEDDGF